MLHSPWASVPAQVLFSVVIVAYCISRWFFWIDRKNGMGGNRTPSDDKDGEQAERVDTPGNHVFKIRLNQQGESSSIRARAVCCKQSRAATTQCRTAFIGRQQEEQTSVLWGRSWASLSEPHTYMAFTYMQHIFRFGGRAPIR